RRHEARAAAGGDAACGAPALLRGARADPRRAAHGERAPAVQRPHDHRAGALRGAPRGGAGAGAALVVPGDRRVSGRSSICLGALLAVASTQAGAQARAAPPSISDNSFLMEEAYNQERGVVQHISAFPPFRGAGALGVQANLPASVVVASRLVTHWNAGATVIPSAQNAVGDKATTVAYNLGASVVWLARPTFNALLEIVWTRKGAVTGAGRTA